MSILQQIKGGATQLFETLGEGWAKLASKSGQALTRFTRRQDAGEEGSELPEVTESWGMLAGEVAENDTEVIVRLEAPGMDKENFDIRIEHGMLRIVGEKRFEREQRQASYHVFESAYGSFERVLPLPSEVDAERAEATYRRGVLTVKLPKTEPRRVRTITVG
jgi:HSP20 family protein